MSVAIKTLGQLFGSIGVANDVANFAQNDPLTQAERLICDVHAQNPSALSLNTENQKATGRRCRQYYEALNVEEPQEAPPPFTGGQCTFEYSVNYDLFNPGSFAGCAGQGTQQVRNLGRIPGPISGFSLQLGAVGGDGRRSFSVIVTGSAGPVTTSSGSFSPSCGQPSVSNFYVTPSDGQADDCGDPPPGPLAPVPNYPRPPTFNPDGTITPNPATGGDTINIDTDIDIDGDEYYEITGPSFTYSRGPGFEDPRLPAEPSPPATEGQPSDETDDSGSLDDDLPPEDEANGIETIGYAWSLSGYPTNAGIVQGTNPEIFFQPLGNIQLVYQTDSGSRFSDNLPIRSESGSLIRRDESLKVIQVRYNKRPDVSTITLTPLRRQKTDASSNG